MPDKRINESNDTGGEEDRENDRRETEEVEQQDLNQGGLDTGTHDTTRHGVDWGRSYRGKKGSTVKRKGAGAGASGQGSTDKS